MDAPHLVYNDDNEFKSVSLDRHERGFYHWGIHSSALGDTNIFSFASLILGTIGAIAGIYVGFKMSEY